MLDINIMFKISAMFIVANIVLDLRQPGPGMRFPLSRGHGFYLQLGLSQFLVWSNWGAGGFIELHVSE